MKSFSLRLRRTASLLAAFSLCFAPLAAHAWGGEGHNHTARLAVRSLPDSPLKELFTRNEDWFATNSSYPDRWRNRPDAAEAPRHFLDGERFGFGTDLTKLPNDFGALLKIRNYEQLRTDGIVPWTAGRHYKLLVIAFREQRWDDAMIQAAYLSHYAADSHVPFHASENYDGQLSVPSQKGIHSRFETQMLQRSIKLEDLKPGTPDKITNPIQQEITICNTSLALVPTILAADKEAVAKTNGEYNSDYWTEFTAKTRPIGIARLEAGGRFLSGLILAAWEEAGKPKPPADFKASDRLLPYAPPFVPRGETPPPTPPLVSDGDKATARANTKTLQIPSKALGKETPVNILLPVGYETSGKRYPVLYLLHGATGKFSDWNTNSGIAAYAQGREMIIVMPDANGDSFYVNSNGMGKVADYFTKDLIPAIDKQYRTIAKREGRAIAGLSMGGYGAWRTALDNPKMFQCAASLSGALFFGSGTVDNGLRRFVERLYGPNYDEKLYAENALLPRIEKMMNKGRWNGPALYFDCGSEDFLIKSNQQLEADLIIKGVPYEYAEFKGAHTWAYWDEHIRDVLQFVERQVQAAK